MEGKLKLRISIFIPSFHTGGVQRKMLNLADGFIKQGHDVDMVLVRAEGMLKSQVPQNVRIFDLRSSRGLKAIPALIQYLKEQKPNWLITSQTHMNVLALWARKLARGQVRVLINEASNLSMAVSQATRTGDRLRPIMARLFYPWADRIIAVSSGVATDLSKATTISRERIDVIYNPIVSPALKINMQSSPAHPWFAPDAPHVLLSAGRLVPEKDYQTFIHAFDQLRMRWNVRLMILGEGPQRTHLEKLTRELGIEEITAFPGNVENPFSYMYRSAVFVLSSTREGLSNALIEAMACGTPVVSTDCPSGPYEILEGGKYGRLVPVGDVEALARAIAETLESPITRETLQRRAQDFSVDVITDQYLRLLFE